MVDIHTHILPEVDDGARSWEMAVHMCHMAAEDGITHMVATPHANDEYEYDRTWLESVLQELRSRIGGLLTLGLGCDFHMSFDNLAKLQENPAKFTISGTRYLLVEFSDFAIPPVMDDKLEEMLAAGVVPIITHPERNMILQRKPERVLDWAKAGCAVQVTASSVTGRWGETARETSHWLMKRGAVHVLATDCHSIEGRPPVMSAARKSVEKTYGVEMAKALTTDNPRAMVENQARLPFFPAISQK